MTSGKSCYDHYTIHGNVWYFQKRINSTKLLNNTNRSVYKRANSNDNTLENRRRKKTIEKLDIFRITLGARFDFRNLKRLVFSPHSRALRPSARVTPYERLRRTRRVSASRMLARLRVEQRFHSRATSAAEKSQLTLGKTRTFANIRVPRAGNLIVPTASDLIRFSRRVRRRRTSPLTRHTPPRVGRGTHTARQNHHRVGVVTRRRFRRGANYTPRAMYRLYDVHVVTHYPIEYDRI